MADPLIMQELTEGDDQWSGILYFDDGVLGLGGDDRMYGAGGDDNLFGGEDDDRLRGDDGNDALHGDDGAETEGPGRQGDDILQGGGGDDELFGGGGKDTLEGGNDHDELFGNSGDDVLDGGEGADDLFGGGGEDTLSSVNLVFNYPVLAVDTAADAGRVDGGGILDGGAHDDIIITSHDFSGTMTVIGGTGVDTLRFGGDRNVFSGVAPSNAIDLDAETGTTPFGSAIVVREIENVDGDSYRDVFRGDDAANILRGFGGSDRLSGRGGADTLDGGAGTDVAEYSGSLGIDVDLTRATQTGGDAQGDTLIDIEEIDGSNFADTIRGDGAANYLFGSLGGDTLEGRGGADTLNGGAGFDFASYESAGARAVVALDDPALGGESYSEGSAAGDVLISIEGLIGSRFGDMLMGNSAGNTIRGGQGDDEIYGLDGSDTLEGGEGYDLLIGGEGNDRLSGGLHGDVLDGEEGSDTADYGFATQNILVQLGLGGASGKANADSTSAFGNIFEDELRSIENVIGSEFNDTIFGNEQANTLNGMGGDDYFAGDLGADTISGGNGRDAVDYNVSPGAITIALDGSAGVGGFAAGDRLSLIETVGGSQFSDSITGNFGENTLFGFGGADTLRGNGGRDTLDGGAGRDVLDGGSGIDTLKGGADSDYYFVDNAADAVVETAAQGTADRVFAGTSYTLGAGVEVEVLTTTDNLGTAAINLTGNEFSNAIFGNAGDNTLDGKALADTLVGFGGNDFYFVDHRDDAVVEGAGEGTADRVFAGTSYTLGAGAMVEMLTTTDNLGTAAVNLTGNEFSNAIFGNAGDNTLDGKALADTLVGFGGNDFYFVDNRDDAVFEGAGEGTADRVFAGTSYTLGAGVEVEMLTTTDNFGTAAINLTGNEFSNAIFGNAGDNALDGRAQADALVGFGGNDFYFVDNRDDAVFEGAGEGTADRVFAGTSYTLGAGAMVEMLTTTDNFGTAAINLTGNEFDNAIFGNAGGNVLNGGLGNDALIGFEGPDVFAFDTPLNATTNVDAIADYNPQADDIMLSRGIFSALAAGPLSASAFSASGTAADAGDRIIYNPATGALFYDADGIGGTGQIQFATIAGAPAITSADFVIV